MAQRDSELTDPLGRRVTLRERTWHGHILKGHPEVGSDRHLVERAVMAPAQIRFSRSDRACRCYYGQGPRRGLMICVVADVERGIVKTAYLSRRIAGGDLEWSEPT